MQRYLPQPHRGGKKTKLDMGHAGEDEAVVQSDDPDAHANYRKVCAGLIKTSGAEEVFLQKRASTPLRNDDGAHPLPNTLEVKKKPNYFTEKNLRIPPFFIAHLNSFRLCSLSEKSQPHFTNNTFRKNY
jgi:hypothetical protein